MAKKPKTEATQTDPLTDLKAAAAAGAAMGREIAKAANAPGLEHVVLADAESLVASANRRVEELEAYISFLHANYPNKLVTYEQWAKKAGR